jgi:hypothetical protein
LAWGEKGDWIQKACKDFKNILSYTTSSLSWPSIYSPLLLESSLLNPSSIKNLLAVDKPIFRGNPAGREELGRRTELT